MCRVTLDIACFCLPGAENELVLESACGCFEFTNIISFLMFLNDLPESQFAHWQNLHKSAKKNKKQKKQKQKKNQTKKNVSNMALTQKRIDFSKSFLNGSLWWSKFTFSFVDNSQRC